MLEAHRAVETLGGTHAWNGKLPANQDEKTGGSRAPRTPVIRLPCSFLPHWWKPPHDIDLQRVRVVTSL
jgi:hypothetical protein